MIGEKPWFILGQELVQVLLVLLPVPVGSVSEPDQRGVDAGRGVLPVLIEEAESPRRSEAEAGVGAEDPGTGTLLGEARGPTGAALGVFGDVEVQGLEEDAHTESPEEGENGREEKLEE